MGWSGAAEGCFRVIGNRPAYYTTPHWGLWLSTLNKDVLVNSDALIPRYMVFLFARKDRWRALRLWFQPCQRFLALVHVNHCAFQITHKKEKGIGLSVNFNEQRGGDSWTQVWAKMFRGVKFTGEKLTGEKLTGKKLAGERLTPKMLTGKELTGEKLAGEKLTPKILPGKKLKGKNLTGEKLTSEKLTGANLSR